MLHAGTAFAFDDAALVGEVAPVSASDPAPVRHPLTTGAAKAARWAHADRSAEAWLADIDVFDSDEGSGVEVAIGEPYMGAVDSARDPAREPVVTFTADDAVSGWLAGAAWPPASMRLDVSFDTRADSTVSVAHQQRLALADGLATTEADLYAIRRAVVAQREREGSARMAGALAEVEASGGVVLLASGALGWARVEVGMEGLDALARHPDVLRLEAVVEATEDSWDAGYAFTVQGDVDGNELQELLQAIPYYDRGFFGNPGDFVGYMDTVQPADNDHPALRDGAHNDRMLNCWGDGQGPACVWEDGDPGGDHPTRAIAVMAADLTLDQDPAVPALADQVTHSGVTRRSLVLNMSRDDSRAADLKSFFGVHVVGRSSGVPNDPDSFGATEVSRRHNALFEMGALTIAAAGNDGATYDPSIPNLCTMGAPATAIGVLAVGAYEVGWGNESVLSKSSWGGTGVVGEEGNGLTIVGVLAPTNILHRATPGGAYNTGPFPGTSAAAPAAAGAAALFRQWYRTSIGAAVDDPGQLTALLLLLGDKLVDFGSFPQVPRQFAQEGFDPRYGAGRLRLRACDTDGGDDPGGYRFGSVCVDHGETKTLSLRSGAALQPGVEYIKFVTWIYDHDHDDTPGAGHDHYDVRLRRHVNGAWVTASLDTRDDNRHRVFSATDVGGYAWQLQISGRDVTSDGEGCGANSNRVYYAGVWEDNSRDDDFMLQTFVRPEPIP